MSLSERLRPDVEAAPWVIEEIKKLEVKIASFEKDEAMFLSEHDENVRLHFENVDLKEQNARLREALERILKASLPHEEPVSRQIAQSVLGDFRFQQTRR